MSVAMVQGYFCAMVVGFQAFGPRLEDVNWLPTIDLAGTFEIGTDSATGRFEQV